MATNGGTGFLRPACISTFGLLVLYLKPTPVTRLRSLHPGLCCLGPMGAGLGYAFDRANARIVVEVPFLPLDRGGTGPSGRQLFGVLINPAERWLGARPGQSIFRADCGPCRRTATSRWVTRYDDRDHPNGTNSLAWPRFSWQIFWNYQGAAAYGTVTTGAAFLPFQMGGGQTSCPTPGTQTQQRCVLFQWPQLRSAYNQNQGGAYFPAWHGSLIQNKRDGSGLEDKRNRAYDPQTGRFTQEDPIGLAGGLNGFGFADSDPINRSDPFGLAANSSCLPWCFVVVAGAAAGLKKMLDNLDAGEHPMEGAIAAVVIGMVAASAPIALETSIGLAAGRTVVPYIPKAEGEFARATVKQAGRSTPGLSQRFANWMDRGGPRPTEATRQYLESYVTAAQARLSHYVNTGNEAAATLQRLRIDRIEAELRRMQ